MLRILSDFLQPWQSAVLNRRMLVCVFTGLSSGTADIDALPDFWGPLWHVRAEGIDLDLIKKIRGFAWVSYEDYFRQAEADPDFDYRPVQDQMILKNSSIEYHLFKKMGLSVSAEAQAAFFSVLCSGI